MAILERRLTLNCSSEMVPEEHRRRQKEDDPRSRSQKMLAHDIALDGCV